MQNKIENYYNILGVSKSSSETDIKKAYKKLAEKYHPDKHINNDLSDLAEAKFKEINEAYEYLKKNNYNHNKIEEENTHCNNNYNEYENNNYETVYDSESIISRGVIERCIIEIFYWIKRCVIEIFYWLIRIIMGIINFVKVSLKTIYKLMSHINQVIFKGMFWDLLLIFIGAVIAFIFFFYDFIIKILESI